MTKSILLVEDNEDDVFLMERALKEANILMPLRAVEHGQEAIDYLSGEGEFADRTQFPIPSIVFLDLKMPLTSGQEVLEWMRQQPEFRSTTVVMLTSSEEQVDLNRAYKLGCDSYLVKPPKAQQLLGVMKAFDLA